MRIFSIDDDMDRDGMIEMKPAFDDLARSSSDVCLDLSQVGFLDVAGVEEMTSLYRSLRGRPLKLGISQRKRTTAAVPAEAHAGETGRLGLAANPFVTRESPKAL